MQRLTVLQLHGWLMWASMGFLFPLGTILIRCNRTQNGTVSKRKAKFLTHLHAFVQSLGVALATVGIVVPLVEIGPSWDYTHQRLGLALFIIALAVPIAGILRPKPGAQRRPYWFIFHWGLGTALLFLGIVNCYIGIHAYQVITKRSLRTLNIVFSIQVAAMTLIWVLQDRWSDIKNQGPQAAQDPKDFISTMNLP